MPATFVVKYQELKKEFQTVKKRIVKTKISKNTNKLNEYRRDIIATHDAIVSHVSGFIHTLRSTDKEYYRNELLYIRDKTIECFGRLRLKIVVSKNLLALVSEGKITNSDSSDESNSDQDISNTTIYADAGETSLIDTEDENNSSTQSESDEGNMAMTVVEFLRISAQTINRNYDGDPLALDAFINSIELLEELATRELQTTFLKFIKSKLEGKALESIPADVANVAGIKAALREQIKPDSSKVIAGRMLALRVDRSKMVDFTQQAELLSEALQRSLIVEGISQAKAREMTIEKAVEVCRNASRSDLVKSVLAATPFTAPKEVIAKFVVESATEYKEKQILAYRQTQRRGNNNNQRGRGSKNGRNFQNNNRSNGYNGGYNNNGNYRGRGNNQGRGRGNGRGRGGYNNQNNGYQEHYVRYTENAGGPGWRADQQTQPQQNLPQAQIPLQRN